MRHSFIVRQDYPAIISYVSKLIFMSRIDERWLLPRAEDVYTMNNNWAIKHDCGIEFRWDNYCLTFCSVRVEKEAALINWGIYPTVKIGNTLWLSYSDIFEESWLLHRSQ